MRFSLSRETTDAEVGRVLELIPGVVEDVRASARPGGCAGRRRARAAHPAMIVECDRCHAKYQYDEARFGGKPAKALRCSKCRAIFEVVNTRAFEAQPGLSPRVPPDETVQRHGDRPRGVAARPDHSPPAGAASFRRTSSSRSPSSPVPTPGGSS